jgi:protein-L-isoaspartate(D-aspartate) O-methyltransferase
MSRLSQIALLTAVVGGGLGCDADSARKKREVRDEPEVVKVEISDEFAADRERMVDDTIVGRGIDDPLVVRAMRAVPRHRFVPPEIRTSAYDDRALPIGYELTISQPYIVATMSEAAKIKPGDKVLEIGTGSGYQAAVLAEMGAEVYTIEIVEELAERTRSLFEKLGLLDKKIRIRIGDGYVGWPSEAPFDAILVTAAAPRVPQPLLDQLKAGGRMVIPVGSDYEQALQVVTKRAGGSTDVDVLFPVLFGPMTGAIRGGP